MSFEIIKYDSKCQKALVDLWKKCDLIVPQNDPIEDIQKKLDFQPGLFFITLLKNKVIGTVMTGYDGHRGWLYYLAVLPEYQKKGIGKSLIKEGLSLLKELGGQGCALVGDPNYYNRFGFKNYPELIHEGVPQEVFLALPFTEKVPQGTVIFDEGFLANG